MLHEIGKELGAFLASKGVPFVVIDGPERTGTTTFARERIVIEHDVEGGDEFGNVLSQRPNPQQKAVRIFGAKITIYAQAPASGAQTYEHRRRAEHVLDSVLVGLDAVVRGRKNTLKLKSGRFDPKPTADLAKSEVANGAVYELKFSVDRGVRDVTWAGAAHAETPLGPGGVTVASETKVSRPGELPADAETACGT